jgi:hypothetical protein
MTVKEVELITSHVSKETRREVLTMRATEGNLLTPASQVMALKYVGRNGPKP